MWILLLCLHVNQKSDDDDDDDDDDDTFHSMFNIMPENQEMSLTIYLLDLHLCPWHFTN